MKPFKSIVMISALCVGVVACQNNTKFSENMLASSGFKSVTPTTPAQVASLRSLPPHKLTRTTHKGRTVWLYSDPTVCGCLYVGNQAAYDAYSKRQTQRAMLDMTSVTAAPVASGQWDFSPWPEDAAEP
jgi:hypothetical protein